MIIRGMARKRRLAIPALVTCALALMGDVPGAASPQPPQRIITLIPSLTELVCALDACDRLVATDRFSNWPERVNSLPKVGGLTDAQIEGMVALKPDVVILAYEARVEERLRALGIATVDLRTDTFADIARDVTALGQLLDRPQRAAELNRQIEATVQTAINETDRQLHGRHPLVYFEVDGGPYAAGPTSFIGDLLSRLGTRNIVAPELGPFPHLNPEYVVRRDPQVMFMSAADVPNLSQRPGWQHLRAVREHRICTFTAAQLDTIVRPGPRVAEGLHTMGECLARVAP